MTTKEHAFRILKFARKNTLAFAEDVPDDKLCWQPFAGANHVLWNLGHLASSDDWAVTVLDPSAKMDERYMKVFGSGSTPSPDPKAYPSRSEVLGCLAQAHGRFLAAIERQSEADLALATAAELKDFAPTRMALLFAMACHEGTHQGQILACRKALGMKPKFM